MAEYLVEGELHERLDFLTAEQANLVWNELEKILVEQTKVQEDGQLTLRGFGTFYILSEGGRPARNPDGTIKMDENGNVVLTDTYDTMRFRSGKTTLEVLNPPTEDTEES